MVSAKLLFVTAILAVLSANASAGFLDSIFPTVIAEHWSQVPYEEGYKFNLKEPNGTEREERGFIMNPGTEKEELVRMGTFTQVDEETGIETTTMYVADKNGYRPMYKIRKLNPGTLKSSAG